MDSFCLLYDWSDCSEDFRPNKHKHKDEELILSYLRGGPKSTPSDLSKRAAVTRRQLKISIMYYKEYSRGLT
jgi:hypothetical protein